MSGVEGIEVGVVGPLLSLTKMDSPGVRIDKSPHCTDCLFGPHVLYSCSVPP